MLRRSFFRFVAAVMLHPVLNWQLPQGCIQNDLVDGLTVEKMRRCAESLGWVAGNFGDKRVTIVDSPSSLAWQLLQYCRTKPLGYRRFLDASHGRLVPDRT